MPVESLQTGTTVKIPNFYSFVPGTRNYILRVVRNSYSPNLIEIIKYFFYLKHIHNECVH